MNNHTLQQMTLENIARACGGTYVGEDTLRGSEITGAVIDSRQVEPGYLYIPIRGERVDGHRFIPDVFAKGALAVLSEEPLDNPAGPYIQVASSEQALKDIIAPNETKQITADYIISMVAEHYNVSTADLCGNKRSSKIVMPRQVAMYLCREILAIPLKNVGQYLGNRDHTTVMHGVEKIEKELQTNEQLQSTIDTLKKKINPQT